MRPVYEKLLVLCMLLTLDVGGVRADLDLSKFQHFRNPVYGFEGRYVIFEGRRANIDNDRFESTWWNFDTATGTQSMLSFGKGRILAVVPDPHSANVAVVSLAGPGKFNIRIIDVETKAQKMSLSLKRFPLQLSWSPDGKKMSFSANVPPAHYFAEVGKEFQPSVRTIVTDRLAFHSDRGGYTTGFDFQLFWVDLATEEVSQLTHSRSLSPRAGMSWSQDSNEIYFSANFGEDWEFELHNLNIYKVNLLTRDIVEVTDHRGKETHGQESPDGKRFAFLSTEDNGTSYQLAALKIRDLASGTITKVPLDLDRKIVSFRWQSDSRSIYVLYEDRGSRVLADLSYDGGLREVTREISAAGYGKPYASGSFDVSPEGALVYSSAPRGYPSQIEQRDLKGQVSTIASANTAWTAGAISLPREFWFPLANDDLHVQGWLYAPNKRTSCLRCPLVVMLHGGTHGFYGPFFSPEVQYYTSNGYYVATINQRGSGSYGATFANMSHHKFPAVGGDDVLDGISYLEQAFPIDKERLYLTGGSAGGAFGTWLLGKTRRFAGAVIAKPTINLVSSFLASDIADYKYATNWFPAMPWDAPEYFWDYSPLSGAGKIKTPVLVMVGIEDLRTPPTEAIQLFRALKFSNTKTAIALFPKVAHSFSTRPSSLLQKIDLTMSWFQEQDAGMSSIAVVTE